MKLRALAIVAAPAMLATLATAAPALASDGPRPARVNVSQNVVVNSDGSDLTVTVYARCDGGGLGRIGVSAVQTDASYNVTSRYSYDSYWGAGAVPCDNVERTLVLTVPHTAGNVVSDDQTVSLWAGITPQNEAKTDIVRQANVRDH